jgi:hypothetical protein
MAEKPDQRQSIGQSDDAIGIHITGKGNFRDAPRSRILSTRPTAHLISPLQGRAIVKYRADEVRLRVSGKDHPEYDRITVDGPGHRPTHQTGRASNRHLTAEGRFRLREEGR